MAQLPEDHFQLYDLEVVVEAIHGHCTCDMHVGDRFFLQGGKLSLPPDGSFCLYALQSAIPLLPAKQRSGHPADWMETDARVTCPDPACGLIMGIRRTGVRTFRHDQVSATPWEDVRSGQGLRGESGVPPGPTGAPRAGDPDPGAGQS